LVLLGGGAALVASSGQQATPTPTATLTPSPTLEPSPTTFQPPEATLKVDNVECRSGPGANATVLGTINRSDAGTFVVTTRSGDLLRIILAGDQTCWVPAAAVDLDDVDVSSIPSAVTLATLTPTPEPTALPSDTPTPTETPRPTNTLGPTRPPATRPPTLPPTVAATPTTAGFPDVDFGWERLGDAIRSGDDWVETVRIDPRGGDGTYVVFFQDVQVNGPPYFIQIRATGMAQVAATCRRAPVLVQPASQSKRTSSLKRRRAAIAGGHKFAVQKRGLNKPALFDCCNRAKLKVTAG
jgi:hypothetical protein